MSASTTALPATAINHVHTLRHTTPVLIMSTGGWSPIASHIRIRLIGGSLG